MLSSRRTRRSIALSSALTLFGTRVGPAFAQEAGTYTFAVLGLDIHTGGGSQRSDSIMISRVNAKTNTVRTLSVPRDLYVDIPGYGNDKINAAYQRGLESDPAINWQSGAGLTLETLAHNFGIDFDGVAVLELVHLGDVVDAVGGLEIDNPYDLTHIFDDGRTRHYPAGLFHLDGDDAEFYIRTRQQDGDGGRVMRQHLVLAALLEKLQQPEILPLIPTLVDQLSDIVHTDIALDVQIQLIEVLPSISQENLAFTNVEELLWSDYTASGAWIYQGDWSTLPAFVQGWLNGEVE